MTTGVASGPTPAEMCPAGQVPVVAAYAIDTGEYRWSTCSVHRAWRPSVVAATSEAVYVYLSTAEETIAFDATDGHDVAVGVVPADPDPAAAREPGIGDNGFVVDGVRINGGQDDPTQAFDPASRTLLWERPGNWVYDDVSAIGDGAVFALEVARAPGQTTRLVGYQLHTGDIRWEQPVENPYTMSSWPWFVAGQRLFTLWFNAVVLSTVDGSVVWRTEYPIPAATDPHPLQMSGVRANATTVFVSFSTGGSG